MSAAHGESHYSAVLNPAKVLAIVKEYGEGNTTERKLALKYGVGQPSIHQILNGRSWSHVTGIKFKGRRMKINLTPAEMAILGTGYRGICKFII